MIYQGTAIPFVDLLPGCTVADNTWTKSMLLACSALGASLGQTIVVTHGTDGQHSGHADPHPFGYALDIRTHGLDVDAALDFLHGHIDHSMFFAQAEDRGIANEHLHMQVQKSLWPTLVDPTLLAEARAKDAAVKDNA